MDKSTEKPILVTGSHRSGSTWAGQMLALNKRLAYIHEPFNVSDEISINPEQFDLWFKYISDHNAGQFEKIFNDILNYKYPFHRNYKQCKTVRHFLKLVRDQGLSLYYRSQLRRPLIKDPIALFSAEWLADKYNMDVLVMIRHPAAFCSSLKIKDWKHDFNDFLKQTELMDRYLYEFRDEILNATVNQLSVIDQAILLWNCIHHTIDMYQTQHPSWIMARHEDLSLQPSLCFKRLYERLNLKFDENIARKILKRTGEHNPTEQVDRNEFIRNSKASIKNWRVRLSAAEIEHIKKHTATVSSKFYRESDW